MQDKEFQALKDVINHNKHAHFRQEKSRAVMLYMNSNTLQLYGEREQLVEISKSIPEYRAQITIENKGSWGFSLRATSIAIPMSLLLASNYQYLHYINFHSTGTFTLPCQIWTKQA